MPLSDHILTHELVLTASTPEQPEYADIKCQTILDLAATGDDGSGNGDNGNSKTKLHSNHRHQHINIRFSGAIPVARPTASKQ